MILTSLILASSAQAWLWSRQSTSPIVDLGYSQYRGTYDSSLNVSSFVGMRYASPPTGDLRWRAPQSPATTSGIQAADNFQKQCYQSGLGAALTNPFTKVTKRDTLQSEDCLFLNVFLPGSLDSTAAKSLPVVVWIHGGGYASGNAVSPSARDLVILSNNQIVAVQMQYRLGAFGFLSSSKIKSNGTVNAGLLDQQFALQWVQSHISKFGGNPNQVTIWGESAGAGSVVQHIIANGGRTNPSLFRAAMTSSIYLPAEYKYDDPVEELIFSGFVSAAGCDTSSDQLACLRAQSDSTLSNANTIVTNSAFILTSAWAPVIDGSFITDRPTVLMNNGLLNGDMVYSVSNVFEASTFVPPVNDLNLSTYLPQLGPELTSSQVNEAISRYQVMEPSDYHRAIGLLTEQAFVCPAYWLLDAFGSKGKKAYKGEFWVYPGVHAQDVTYYMPTILTTSDITNKVTPFLRTFAQSFLSVVLYQVPNLLVDVSSFGSAGSNIQVSQWDTWSKSNPFELQFSNTSDGKAAIGPARSNDGIIDRCDFWKSLSSNTHQ